MVGRDRWLDRLVNGLFICCISSGRLPIRVELKGLTEEDMYRILTEPVNNLITQQVNRVILRSAGLFVGDLIFLDSCWLIPLPPGGPSEHGEREADFQ